VACGLNVRPKLAGSPRIVKAKSAGYSRTTEGGIRILDVDLDIVRKKPYMDLELQSFDIVEVLFSKKDKIPEVLPTPCFSRTLKGIH